MASGRWFKFRISLRVLLVLVNVAGVLAMAVANNFRSARIAANRRACCANQRTLVGAIEMYALDHGATPDQKNAFSLNADALSLMINGGYLRSEPSDPGTGPSTWAHYAVRRGRAGEIEVYCKYHGGYTDAPTTEGFIRAPTVPESPIVPPPRGLPEWMKNRDRALVYHDPAKLHAEALAAR